MTRFLRSLGRDRRGATIIEFAIVAPVMMIVLMGLGDMLHQVYAQSILDGALQKAGRDSAIQGGAENTAAIDAKVKSMVGSIVKNGTWSSTRKSYADFSSIKPEDFTDGNGNGRRDPGECFTDINGNSTWDADPGRTGQGGANDVALYTMTISFPRVFPVAKLLGASNTQTIRSQTLLKNQPFATQTVNTPATICD